MSLDLLTGEARHTTIGDAFGDAPVRYDAIDTAYAHHLERRLTIRGRDVESARQNLVHRVTLAADGLRFRIEAEAAMTATRGAFRITTLVRAYEGERLFGAVNDNPLTELYPSSPTHFFARTANAQVDFQPGPDGRASGLTLKLNGVDMTATRTGD